jgi:SET domain-containing protein
MQKENLEKKYKFKYLSKNIYESDIEKNEIYQKGIDKFKKNLVLGKEIDLGKRFQKQIKLGYIASSYVKFLEQGENVGAGLFFKEDVEKGSFIGEYTGEVRKNNRRYFEPINNYCYEYPVTDSLNRSYVVDATNGNLTRFINHSNLANLDPKYAYLDGCYHIIFIAKRKIFKDEQAFYDYGKNYWLIRSKPKNLQIF